MLRIFQGRLFDYFCFLHTLLFNVFRVVFSMSVVRACTSSWLRINVIANHAAQRVALNGVMECGLCIGHPQRRATIWTSRCRRLRRFRPWPPPVPCFVPIKPQCAPLWSRPDQTPTTHHLLQQPRIYSLKTEDSPHAITICNALNSCLIRGRAG